MKRPDIESIRMRLSLTQKMNEAKTMGISDWDKYTPIEEELPALLDYIEWLEAKSKELCESAEAVLKAHRETLGEL